MHGHLNVKLINRRFEHTMEVTRSSDTSVYFFNATRCHIPEDGTLHTDRKF